MAYWELQPSCSTDKEGNREYTRKFLVQLGYNGPPEDAIAAVPIARYDPYPTDPYALAEAATCEPVSGQLGFYEISYSYSNQSGEKGSTSPSSPGDAQTADYTQRVPVVTFGSNRKSKPFAKDRSLPNQKDVVASNGQPFDPPLEADYSNATVNIKFWVPLTTDITLKKLTYENTLNAADFTVFPGQSAYPAEKLKCNSYGATSDVANGVYEVNLELEYSRDGWDIEVVDAGTYEYTPGSEGDPEGNPPKYVPIKDTEGQPVQAAVPLDGAGKKKTVVPPFHYLTFKPYDTTSWANILAA